MTLIKGKKNYKCQTLNNSFFFLVNFLWSNCDAAEIFTFSNGKFMTNLLSKLIIFVTSRTCGIRTDINKKKLSNFFIPLLIFRWQRRMVIFWACKEFRLGVPATKQTNHPFCYNTESSVYKSLPCYLSNTYISCTNKNNDGYKNL